MSFYTDAVMADSPVAYWRLGESAGTVAHDATENALNGAFAASGVTKGVLGPLSDGTFGVLLDGSSGYVSVPDASAIRFTNGICSVEAWVNFVSIPSNATTYHWVAGKTAIDANYNGGYLLGIENATSGGKPFFTVGSDASEHYAVSPTGLVAGAWYHLVGVADGATLYLYVNGALVDTSVQNEALEDTTGHPFVIGSSGSSRMVNASIDEVAIYPTALSAARVAAHYAAAFEAPTGAGTWTQPKKLYTYYAANPLTDALVDELPLRNVQFGTQLNGIGSFSADLPLGDSKLVPPAALNSTAPNQTALWVDRGGVLVWGGLIWTRSYDSTTETLKIAGNDFLSYFEHRYITDTLTFTNVDQLSLVQQLLQYAQGQNASYPKPGGNVNVQYPSPYPTSGVLRSATYQSYELKQIAQAIQEISQQDTGFDFGFDVQYVAGVPTVTFNPSYPRRGRTAQKTGWVFELPGNITAYTYDEDGTQTEVTSYAVGGGTGTTMFRSSASTTSLIDNGYPLFEGVHSYKDVTDQPTLDAHARADAAAFAGPVAVASATVLGSAFSGPITGDDVRLRITDRRFNKGFNADGTPIGPGLDTFLRIIGIDVTPGDDTMELVKLTLGPAPQ